MIIQVMLSGEKRQLPIENIFAVKVQISLAPAGQKGS
jgi:hypothetical protein